MRRSRGFPVIGLILIILALLFIFPGFLFGWFHSGRVGAIPFNTFNSATPGNGSSVVNGTMEVGNDEVVNHNLNAVNSKVTIRGTVYGNVTLVNSTADIYGTVNGDVIAVNSPVTLYSKAAVNRIVNTNSPVTQQPGSTIRSNVPNSEQNQPRIAQPPAPVPPMNPNTPPFPERGMRDNHRDWFNPFSSFMTYLALAGLGILIASLFPRQFNRAETALRSDVARVGMLGLLSIVAAIPLTIVLAVLIISIPLIPVLWALIAAGAIFGFAVIIKVVGERLLQAFNARNLSITPITAIGAGALALWLVSMVPFFGGLTIAIVWMIGLGLAVMTRMGTRSNLGWMNPAWSNMGTNGPSTPPQGTPPQGNDVRYSPVQPGPSPYTRPGQTPPAEPPANPNWSAPATTRLPDDPDQPEKL